MCEIPLIPSEGFLLISRSMLSSERPGKFTVVLLQSFDRSGQSSERFGKSVVVLLQLFERSGQSSESFGKSTVVFDKAGGLLSLSKYSRSTVIKNNSNVKFLVKVCFQYITVFKVVSLPPFHENCPTCPFSFRSYLSKKPNRHQRQFFFCNSRLEL